MDSMLPMFNHVHEEQFRDICILWVNVIIGDPCEKKWLSVKSTEKRGWIGVGQDYIGQ
jgi:hypothetical protein